MKKAELPQMKVLIYLLLSLTALAVVSAAYAISESYEVVQRKRNGKFAVIPTVLDGLFARDRFETEHFKIVWKKEEEALTLDRIDQIVLERKTTEKDNPLWVDRDAKSIRLMAATALYHAEVARKFWMETLGSEEVRKLGQVVIRLDLTSFYSEFERFANDNHKPQYNNALSIDAGKPYKPRPGLNPWGREIWFRPRKEIPIREILAQLPEDPSNSQLREARHALYPMQIDQAVRNTLFSIFNSRLDSNGYIASISRQAGTLLLLEGAFQVLKVVNRAIIPQHFYIDAAFVPEIIYHEYAHIAMADFMRPDVSTPVNEGMADYFAAAITNNPKQGKEIKKFSTAIGKNGKKKQLFQIEFESLAKAQSDFVLSLLWGLRDVLGEKVATQVIFDARKSLNTKDSDIRTGLVSALIKSCDTVCTSPFRDRLLIHQYLNERGL